MAKPTSPRWSSVAADSPSSRVTRADILPVSCRASIGICAAFPPSLRGCITFDRDTEFAAAKLARHHQLFLLVGIVPPTSGTRTGATGEVR